MMKIAKKHLKRLKEKLTGSGRSSRRRERRRSKKAERTICEQIHQHEAVFQDFEANHSRFEGECATLSLLREMDSSNVRDAYAFLRARVPVGSEGLDTESSPVGVVSLCSLSGGLESEVAGLKTALEPMAAPSPVPVGEILRKIKRAANHTRRLRALRKGLERVHESNVWCRETLLRMDGVFQRVRELKHVLAWWTQNLEQAICCKKSVSHQRSALVSAYFTAVMQVLETDRLYENTQPNETTSSHR